MWRPLLGLGLVAGIVVAAVIVGRRSPPAQPGHEPAPVVVGQVGRSAEINKAIRQGLRRSGERSRCDEGPPSAERQAEWKRVSRPSELAAVPFAALLKREDRILNSEVYGRLLDKSYSVGLGGMSRPEQNVLLVLMLQGDLANSGFRGFFANPAGNCAKRTEAALAEMGHAETLRIYTAALAKFPGGAPSEDRRERGDQMEALGDEYAIWAELDDLYYKAEFGEALMARYVRQHAASFALPP
jgi:hypothetical protein